MPTLREHLPYYQVNKAEIGGIKIYVKRWLPESKSGTKPSMIGISDGSNFIDFKDANDLSDTIQDINATPTLQPKGINLPIESIKEITDALSLLARRLLWVVVT